MALYDKGVMVHAGKIGNIYVEACLWRMHCLLRFKLI